ncbi:MAG: shikimate dehydrogenase [Leptolyngbyaceae cyanobacterium SM1_1_3]|nr:shikimate dehydrogenase [Leptolyngbyaceae cyanobacterium SM1_1_3]NJN01363.1 shikimate dehydrogenase [Leptolyngbyaceae cyanobacterium RM1_1_2]
MITGTTKLLGVIGQPVEHSLSPVMHNAALAALGADFVYLPLPVPRDRLREAIQGFAAIGLRGFNVTIPHKQEIMPLLSEISEVAQAVGAVNTVWATELGWSGTNTDITGFLAPLRSRQCPCHTALVLGNGGAARAVVAGCTQLGCQKVQVVGRSLEKLERFQSSWQKSLLPPLLSVHAWDALPALLPQADLVVNTTPVGMSPQTNASPLDDALADCLAQGAIAYDLIYTPSPTRFLQQATARGLTTLDGLEMLVQQGAAALEIWLEQPAPVEVMRRSLQQALSLGQS